MKKKQEAHSPVPEQPGELFHLCFLRVGGRQGGAEQWAVGFHEFLSQHFLCRLLLQVCASNLPAILLPTRRWSSKMAWHQIRVLRRRRFAVPLPHPSNPRSATARMAPLLPPPHPTGPPPCIRPARTQLYKSSLRRPNPRLKPPTPQLLGGWKLENKSKFLFLCIDVQDLYGFPYPSFQPLKLEPDCHPFRRFYPSQQSSTNSSSHHHYPDTRQW